MSVETAVIFELITAPDNAALRRADGPVWLWDARAQMPAWANAAALRLFGAADFGALVARTRAGVQPDLARLGVIAARLPMSGERIERLRIFSGGRDTVLACRCRWLKTPAGRLLAVAAPSPAAGSPARPGGADAAARDLLAGFAGPAVAFDAAGRPLFVNAAADPFGVLAGPPELAALAARALVERTADGVLEHAGAPVGAAAVAVGTGADDAFVAVRLEPRATAPVQPAAEPATAGLPAPQRPPAAAPPEAPAEPPYTDVIFKPDWNGRASPGAGAPTAAPDRPGNVLPFRNAGPVPPGEDGRLEPQERDAFRALADALGARMEGDEEKPPAAAEPVRPAAATASAGEAAPREMLAVLSRLPLGLLVYRQSVPLYANRALLDLFGFATFAELAAAGSIAGLLPRLAGEAGGVAEIGPECGEEAGPRMLVAHDRSGRTLPVVARLQAIRWNGEPAILLTARPPDGTQSWPAAGARRNGALSGSEAAAALALAVDGTIIVSADGRIAALDGKAQELFGGRPAELAGAPLDSLFAAESRRAIADCLAALNDTAGQGGRESLVQGRRADGTEMALQMAVVRLGDDPARRYCAIVRDVSRQVRAEAELAAAARAADSASRQKSEFLARVSHEIRTPLNSILGFAELIQQERFGSLGNERYRAYLEDILTSGRHLLGLVNDLLDLSKVEAGKLELNFTGVDVNDVAVQCIRLMLNEAAQGRVIVRSSLGRHLPAVVADQRSLKQILLNLLSNAIKFTLPGGQVVLSTRQTEAGEVQVRVRDTGVGMAQQDIALAMEPFRQVATAFAPRTPGAGLGLPLTRALAHANRARFHIESASGRGTLAEVTFPPQRVLAG